MEPDEEEYLYEEEADEAFQDDSPEESWEERLCYE
jgi:hypothetical protein